MLAGRIWMYSLVKQRYGQNCKSASPEIQTVIENIQGSLKSIESHRADIDRAQKQLYLWKTAGKPQSEMDQINRRTSKIEAIDSRIANIDTVVSIWKSVLNRLMGGTGQFGTENRQFSEIIDRASMQIDTINSK